MVLHIWSGQALVRYVFIPMCRVVGRQYPVDPTNVSGTGLEKSYLVKPDTIAHAGLCRYRRGGLETSVLNAGR
jgi:hypothetical protein